MRPELTMVAISLTPAEVNAITDHWAIDVKRGSVQLVDILAKVLAAVPPDYERVTYDAIVADPHRIIGRTTRYAQWDNVHSQYKERQTIIGVSIYPYAIHLISEGSDFTIRLQAGGWVELEPLPKGIS